MRFHSGIINILVVLQVRRNNCTNFSTSADSKAKCIFVWAAFLDVYVFGVRCLLYAEWESLWTLLTERVIDTITCRLPYNLRMVSIYLPHCRICPFWVIELPIATVSYKDFIKPRCHVSSIYCHASLIQHGIFERAPTARSSWNEILKKI